jgi:hypothetical protein
MTKGATPALTLLAFNTEGVPTEVAAKIEQLGGYWNAVLSVVPALRDAARVTSSGDIHVPVADGHDIERALKALHDRLWLAGLGWLA